MGGVVSGGGVKCGWVVVGACGGGHNGIGNTNPTTLDTSPFFDLSC